MYTSRLLIITIIKLVTAIVGQVWPPYEMYDTFYNSHPYQGYGSGCMNIRMTEIPCQQRFRQWSLYPNDQLQNYNTRPYIGLMPHMFIPYDRSDRMLSHNTGIPVDFLNHGILLNNAETATIDGNALAPKLLGANILNDKQRFVPNGCSYDTNDNKCIDSLNLCKGKCKNFGNNLTHDCRCVPEDLLTILGLATIH
ncbi:unnamed protein product [Wuchereria bancrofti]|uniref:Uncharacterized protein n=1 Tax=Wuchereria bancrofti TaxID=6293 RepID=A0A183Y086_WUCBA|nr:unnamed protein product [Wuchereria bancrofti]